MNLQTRTFAELWTGHITAEDNEALTKRARVPSDLIVHDMEDQFLIVVPYDGIRESCDLSDLSPQLVRCLDWAIANNCYYLLVTQLAPDVDGLEIYEW